MTSTGKDRVSCHVRDSIEDDDERLEKKKSDILPESERIINPKLQEDGAI